MNTLSLARNVPAKSLLSSLWQTCTRVSGAGYHILTVPWRKVDQYAPTTISESPMVFKGLLPPSPVLYTPCAGMKVFGKVRRRCKHCYFTMIDERLHVMCDVYPRHKQKQIIARYKNRCLLTHATTHKIRPW